MTQEALKKMYQLLLTEPHAPTVCAQLERIAREALADHAMRETQQLKAMKMALEALKNYAWHGEACPQHPTYSKPENYPKCTCGFDKAITAIKEALAEHAMRETQRLGQEIEQEPVAYYLPHKGFYWAKPTSISAPTIADVEPLPLYTAPPQRKPLTFAGKSISEIRLANGLIARLVKDILIVEFD